MPLSLAVSRSAGKNLSVLMVAPEHWGGVSCCRVGAFYGPGAMMAEKMLYMNKGGGNRGLLLWLLPCVYYKACNLCCQIKCGQNYADVILRWVNLLRRGVPESRQDEQGYVACIFFSRWIYSAF